VPVRDSDSPPTRCVLIAEDHPDLREMFRLALEQAGCRTIEAIDGPSAVEVGLSAEPEAAFIDIGLPGFDGREVARRLRAARGTRLFLIGISGYGQEPADARGDDALFDLYLVKPVTLERVREILEQIARR
jgi:CheY-like chemotaxis protein